ncbi:MAG: LysR family transcriptional regulator, partial [Acidobacteriota bacterium]
MKNDDTASDSSRPSHLHLVGATADRPRHDAVPVSGGPMHLLEIRHLLLVAAVADEGSLTRAGERLNLTQSALSHQLLDIEERLRTALFHRVSRKMVLTEAGQRVLTSARRILDDLARTEEDLRLYAADRRGVIRLTTECYTCYHWLPALMKQFEKTHPGIEIRI